jgi:hypothetical protein
VAWPAAPAAIRVAAQIFNKEEIVWRCVMLHPFRLTELGSLTKNGPQGAVFGVFTTGKFSLSI